LRIRAYSFTPRLVPTLAAAAMIALTLALGRWQTERAQEKEAKQALGATVLTQVAEWTPSTLLSLGARMATRALPFNLVVTNVPGPQVPLYMLGAKMLDNYGFVPLTDYLSLGIVLFSYAGKLCWGFTADWDLLPDLHDFVLDIEASFRELRDAPESIEVHRERKTAHPKRSTRRHVARAESA